VSIRNRFGHVCTSCGTRTYPKRKELARAARLRCAKCGGTLIECVNAASKIASANDAQNERVASARKKMGIE